MPVNGNERFDDDGIPLEVEAEMAADAAAYDDAARLAGRDIWYRDRGWKDRLARRWRVWRRHENAADAKAAAARRAGAVVRAERRAYRAPDDQQRRRAWLAYFAALREVKRYDGPGAMYRVMNDAHRRFEFDANLREFERQSVYVVDPRQRAALLTEIFDEQGTQRHSERDDYDGDDDGM